MSNRRLFSVFKNNSTNTSNNYNPYYGNESIKNIPELRIEDNYRKKHDYCFNNEKNSKLNNIEYHIGMNSISSSTILNDNTKIEKKINLANKYKKCEDYWSNNITNPKVLGLGGKKNKTYKKRKTTRKLYKKRKTRKQR
jgi:hypothetical protein